MSNLPPKFKRRLNHHKFELEMKNQIESAFISSGKQKNLFEKHLIYRSLFHYFLDRYNLIFPEIFTQEERDAIGKYLIETYKTLIDMYFSNAKKRD